MAHQGTGKDYSDIEMRIVLLGKTGSGKSSTGNTILKKDMFEVNMSLEGVTKESRRCYKDLEDKIITVIHTPGLCVRNTLNKVKDHLEEAIRLAYPGVHVFLLVMKLDTRLSVEEMNTIQWILDTLGEEARKHIIVLFTHGNVLREKSIEHHLCFSPDLTKKVREMADYHVLDNENEDDKTQVTELMKKIEKVMDNNRKQMYTQVMYDKVQNKQPKQEKSESLGYAGIAGVAAVGLAVTLMKALK